MKEIARGINEDIIRDFEYVENCLLSKRAKFYFMETNEIDVLENSSGQYDMADWVKMESIICQQIGKAVDKIKGPRFWQKRKLLQAMQSTKPNARLNHLTLAENYDYIERGNAMLGLAGLSQEPFYMPYSREEYEQNQNN